MLLLFFNHTLLIYIGLMDIPLKKRGVPDIQVSFDVDANGILNVTACDKESGKAEKITITNEESRLSADEIAKMVQSAENFKKDEEGKNKDKFKADTIEDDRKIIYKKCEDGMTWLSKFQKTKKEEDFKKKQKEFETFFNPIVVKHGLNLQEI